MVEPYNPLSKMNLGKSVAEAILDQDPHPLGQLPAFDGAGIYVIYYRGDHPSYERLAQANRTEWRVPIYIGKAIPSGGRQGTGAKPKKKPESNIGSRLAEHAESVRAAKDLNVDDFAARWLVVDEVWIPLGESLLINKFVPVWNVVLDGFGNHNPGSGRYKQKISRWDVMHPGRSWATLLAVRPDTKEQLADLARTYLEGVEFPEDLHMRFDSAGQSVEPVIAVNPEEDDDEDGSED